MPGRKYVLIGVISVVLGTLSLVFPSPPTATPQQAPVRDGQDERDGQDGRGDATEVAAERVRSPLSKAIRTAIKHLEENHSALGQHLHMTIRTETFCIYAPDTQTTVVWQT